METVVQNVMDYARAYLNDIPGNQWNNEVLLPYVKLAWDELQIELQSRDLQVMNEDLGDVAVDKDVNIIEPPDDFICPFSLYEKGIGQTDSQYRLMTPKAWTPNIEASPYLNYWVWREQVIEVPPHTEDRIVRIKYLKAMADIVDENTALEVNNCRVIMAKRTAGLASRYGNSNPTRADLLDAEAMYFIEKMTGIQVKQKQNTQGTRRKPYGFSRRAHGVVR